MLKHNGFFHALYYYAYSLIILTLSLKVTFLYNTKVVSLMNKYEVTSKIKRQF